MNISEGYGIFLEPWASLIGLEGVWDNGGQGKLVLQSECSN